METLAMSKKERRRMFLQDSLLLATGACTGVMVPGLLREQPQGRALAEAQTARNRFEQKLRELGIELPPQAKPVAVYVPAVVTGNLLFTAGHIPPNWGRRIGERPDR